ncbi:MAG: FAD-binding oxidoreductase [Candidatus Woesearchaeota archaeon]
MAEDLTKQIDSSTEFFDIICSSKDCAPEMKKKLLRSKRASAVFYPKNKNEVRKILMNYKCVIRGGGSSYLGQVIPDHDEVIIDMSRFDSVKIYNDYAIIGGGVPFSDIIKKTAQENKELKSFPLSYRSATPAGFLSCGGRAGIGSPENGYFSENIDEIEVVTPNSEILRIKGTEIDDFSGSEGLLGAITEMKIKIQPKKIRHLHMYGFDSRIDLERFFEETKDIRFAYFFNKIAADRLNDKWKLKTVPAYTMICQDLNDKDDYRREYREDLAKRGISFIYPKWILELESKRMNMLDFMIKDSRNNIHIADGIGSVDKTLHALRHVEKHNLPAYGMLGKDEILIRIYADCKDFLDKQKFLMIMDNIYRSIEPASKGRFFRSYISGKDKKHLQVTINKYNVPGHLNLRQNLNKNILVKKIISPLLISMGGKLW